MNKRLQQIILAAVVAMCSNSALANDSEISLFDGRGEAVAYISISEGLTLYLLGRKACRLSQWRLSGQFRSLRLQWSAPGLVQERGDFWP